MKQFVASAIVAAVVSAEASQECLYCRQKDQQAGFMVSYSYCDQSKTCLKDAWNYITRACEGGWKRGSAYQLDFCEPEETNCPQFVSSLEKYQNYENQTWSLAIGSKCTVGIDAREGLVARIILSNQASLGIEKPKFNIDDVYTVKNTYEEIILYNGNEKGPLTFDISFSGSEFLTVGATSVAALVAFLNF